MTTELTKAAQQALEALKNVTDYDQINAARRALQAALTQRPAAQTERDILNDSAWIAGAKFGWNCGVEGTRDLLNQCIEQRIKDRVEARASLPAPQQATPEPIPMVMHCPKCGMQHIDAPESGDVDDGHVTSHGWDNPPHRSHLCHGCGTIWRPADVPTTGVKVIGTKGKADTWEPEQAATPEPVRDVAGVFARDKYDVWHMLPPGSTRGTTLYTRPAPGVPESPSQLRKRFEQHMRDVFACKDTAFLSIDGGKTYLDGSMDNHWRTWLAAAQAKGGAA